MGRNVGEKGVEIRVANGYNYDPSLNPDLCGMRGGDEAKGKRRWHLPAQLLSLTMQGSPREF